MISPNLKFIFTHISRTGGASIELVFNTIGIKKPHLNPLYSEQSKKIKFEASQHWKSTEERIVIGDELWKKYFKFTIVRNPWDRMVSQYFGHVIKDVPGLSIEDYFLKLFVKEEYIDFKRITQPCMEWITDDEGNMLVDYIGRFEKLQKDFNTICDKIGVNPIVLPQSGKSTRSHYRNYYNDYTAELVYNAFKSDIEEFNYKF